MAKPITRITKRRIDTTPKPFEPTTKDLQEYKIVEARLSHNPIGSRGVYMWCNWFNGVAVLRTTDTYNFCDKCHKVLWSTFDQTPMLERAKWMRPGNRGIRKPK